jgi:hypothetical protein
MNTGNPPAIWRTALGSLWLGLMLIFAANTRAFADPIDNFFGVQKAMQAAGDSQARWLESEVRKET